MIFCALSVLRSCLIRISARHSVSHRPQIGCSYLAGVSEHLGDTGDEPVESVVYSDESLFGVPLWRSPRSHTCIIADLACQAAQTIMTVHITVWLFFFKWLWLKRLRCNFFFFLALIVYDVSHGCRTLDSWSTNGHVLKQIVCGRSSLISGCWLQNIIVNNFS